MGLFDYIKKRLKDGEVLDQSVQQLTELYSGQGGFNYYSEAAEPVKKIGRALNRQGGFKLMLKAHEQFVQIKGKSLARNLEQVWHGIGGWSG